MRKAIVVILFLFVACKTIQEQDSEVQKRVTETQTQNDEVIKTSKDKMAVKALKKSNDTISYLKRTNKNYYDQIINQDEMINKQSDKLDTQSETISELRKGKFSVVMKTIGGTAIGMSLLSWGITLLLKILRGISFSFELSIFDVFGKVIEFYTFIRDKIKTSKVKKKK